LQSTAHIAERDESIAAQFQPDLATTIKDLRPTQQAAIRCMISVAQDRMPWADFLEFLNL
jgi:hypothetical protein